MAEKKRSAATSPLEWVSALLGGLIALALLGLIGWEAATGPNRGPAAIAILPQRIAPAGQGYVVEVAVSNGGDVTAAAVEIEGALKQGSAAVETSRATLDYVPARARRRAALVFTRNPVDYRLELRATGYAEP